MRSQDTNERYEPGLSTLKDSPEGSPGLGTTKGRRYKKPSYLNTMSEAEKDANLKVIENMNKRLNYLKNPRHKEDKAPILMQEADDVSGEISSSVNPFAVSPLVVQFQDCQENSVYELQIKLTNKTGISRRIRWIPPKTEYFAIGNVKFPSSETGMIAPGMSVVLTVRFASPGLGDLDDEITFISEEQSFKVPVIARRTPPEIQMESPIVATPCWLGVRTERNVPCTNIGGETTFNLLPGNPSLASKQPNPDYLSLGPFSILPPQFLLPRGETFNLLVYYAPDKPGEHVEDLILETSFKTQTMYKLVGTGCVLDLEATQLDEMKLNFKINPLSVIYFDVTKPNSIAVRRLRVRNNCGMEVHYHWSIYKSRIVEKISLTGEETHYAIEPLEGVFKANEEQEFSISFKPIHAESYFEYADLIVDDVPIQAVQDAPESLKELLRPGVGGPTYLGSNTRYPSFPYLKFTLQGYGDSREIIPEPPVLGFPGDMLIDKTYATRIKLLNKSKSAVKTKIHLKGKSSSKFDIIIGSEKIVPLDSQNTLFGGVLTEEEDELEITIQSHSTGNHRAYFVGEIEDGNPFSFEIFGHFVGPKTRLIEKQVDFGLIRTNSFFEYRLNIENLSDIESEIIVKNSRNKALNFSTMNYNKLNTPPNESRKKSIMMATSSKSSILQKCSNIEIKPDYIRLPPLGKTSILISLHSGEPETISENLEIMTKYSGSQFTSLYAEIQKPYLSLNRAKIDLETTYAGIEYCINGKHKYALKLRNHGNLDAQFHWEDRMVTDEITAIFEPARGVIKARSEQLIIVNITLYRGGHIEELFVCNVEDMDAPLGFVLYTDVFGLSVSYELYDETSLLARTERESASTLLKTAKDLSALLPPSRYDNGPTSRKQIKHVNIERKELTLHELDFPNCMINKIAVKKFVMKNNSGIRAPFTLRSSGYEPLRFLEDMIPPQQPQKNPLVDSVSSKKSGMEYTERSESSKKSKVVKFAVSTKSHSTVLRKKKVYALQHPLLTEAHEQDKKFSSAIGETYTATRRVEQEQNFYLENNKGISVVCQPHKGELAPHSEIIITVSIYNNVCGRYEDTLISEVKGLPAFSIPMRINIKGSPITIPSNQVGVYFNEDPPALVMKPSTINGGHICKSFKIKNTGIQDIEVDWKICDLMGMIDNKDSDLFQLQLAVNEGNPKDPYRLEAIVHEEESKDSPFHINPRKIVISSKEIATFEVAFDTTHSLGIYNSVLVSHPHLVQSDKGTEASPNLGVIYLSLRGETLNPHLTIDKLCTKKKMAQIDTSYKFDVWPNSLEGVPAAAKKISLTNESLADLTFNIAIEGPFEIVSTSTNSPPHPLAKPAYGDRRKQPITTIFTLLPSTFLEVMCKMKKPNPNNLDEWPMALRTVKSGKLIVSYSNGSIEEIMLQGNLLRPYLTINMKDARKNEMAELEYDFGTVYIDTERSKDVVLYLKNKTRVTSKWELNHVKILPKQFVGHKTITRLERENIDKVDDPSVFAFSLSEGVLMGPSTQITWMPQGESVPHTEKDEFNSHLLPQEIRLLFLPKKPIFYKSKFRILVDQGISSEIILKGTGAIKEIDD